jgi:hypothetical protein
MQILVGEQRDLALEPVERGLLERPTHEIRADEQRDGDGTENGDADREPQSRLKRHQASVSARDSRMR